MHSEFVSELVWLTGSVGEIILPPSCSCLTAVEIFSNPSPPPRAAGGRAAGGKAAGSRAAGGRAAARRGSCRGQCSGLLSMVLNTGLTLSAVLISCSGSVLFPLQMCCAGSARLLSL
ncbi:hypothetical protein NQZ68_031254 [Dissostichus eleginoides]|nr:hypothetical protein NQZ68_031254 [Dissostichus eleginoides]